MSRGMTSIPTTGPTGLMLAGLLLFALVIPPVGLLVGLVGLTVARFAMTGERPSSSAP